MRKLIVGCGYLGKRIAREWISQGHQVFALTRSHSRAEELRKAGIEPLLGDVTHEGLFDKLQPVETLLYSVGFDQTGGKSRQEVTVDGLRNVLQQLRGKIERLLYISTTSLYGIDDGSRVDAETACRPQTENGLLAAAAEEIVRESWCRVSGCILRLSGIYGRGRLLARQQGLLEGIPLSGNPDGWLNLIHVEDAVTAVLAAELRGTRGATYLVSDDHPIPRREYYSLLAELIGAPDPQYRSTTAELVKFNKRCDNRRTKAELGWSLRFPTIRTGLPDAIFPE